MNEIYLVIAATSDGKLYANSLGGDEDDSIKVERMKRGCELAPETISGMICRFYVEDGQVKTKNVATWGVA